MQTTMTPIVDTGCPDNESNYGADDNTTKEVVFDSANLKPEPHQTREYDTLFIGRDIDPDRFPATQSVYGLFNAGLGRSSSPSDKMSLNKSKTVLFVHCAFDEIDARIQWVHRTFPDMKQVIVWKFFHIRSGVRYRSAGNNVLAKPTGSFLLLAVNWDVDMKQDVANSMTAYSIDTNIKNVDQVALDVASTFFPLTHRLLITKQCRKTCEYDVVVTNDDYSDIRFLSHKVFTPTSAPLKKKFQAFLEYATLENLVSARPSLELIWHPKHQIGIDLEKRMEIWSQYVPFLPSPEHPDIYAVAKNEQWLRRLKIRIQQLRRQKRKLSVRPKKSKEDSDAALEKRKIANKGKGFAALVQVSPAMQTFLSTHYPEELLQAQIITHENAEPTPASCDPSVSLFRRTTFQQLLSRYIKTHGLQNPQNRKMVMIGKDADLSALLQPGKDEVSYMNIPALLNPHFLSKARAAALLAVPDNDPLL